MAAAELVRSQDVLQQYVIHVISDSTLQGFTLDRKLQSMASEGKWNGLEGIKTPSLITSYVGGPAGTKGRGNGKTSLNNKDKTSYTALSYAPHPRNYR